MNFKELNLSNEKEYFCNSCGLHFSERVSERDKNGILNDISCPHCGAYDIYPDTHEGAAQSVKDVTKYENTSIAWVD